MIMAYVLFAASVLIWGTTWYAIGLQVSDVPVVTSVFYRFALSALAMMAWLAATGQVRRPRWRAHRWFMLLGLCLFSLNFLCFYTAARAIPTGLAAVIFSLATLYNAALGRLFFGDRVPGRVIVAGLLGGVGVLLLFRRELFAHQLDPAVAAGIGLALLGTGLFSLGNMVTRRIAQSRISIVEATAWGMSYGALGLGLLVWLSGAGLAAPPSRLYLGALLYLALIGSALGFTVYLLLVARIGSAKAAYATVLFPVVALSVSTLLEGYHWEGAGLIGVALTLLGNLIIFARWPARPGG